MHRAHLSPCNPVPPQTRIPPFPSIKPACPSAVAAGWVCKARFICLQLIKTHPFPPASPGARVGTSFQHLIKRPAWNRPSKIAFNLVADPRDCSSPQRERGKTSWQSMTAHLFRAPFLFWHTSRNVRACVCVSSCDCISSERDDKFLSPPKGKSKKGVTKTNQWICYGHLYIVSSFLFNFL